MFFCFFKQKTAYEMRISDWSSDVCSSDLSWAGCLTGLFIRRLFAGGLPGQPEAEDGAALGIGFGPQAAVVGFDDRTADRQTDAHAVLLAGDKWREQSLGDPRRDARAGIADGDLVNAVLGKGAAHQLAQVRVAHHPAGIDRKSTRLNSSH